MILVHDTINKYYYDITTRSEPSYYFLVLSKTAQSVQEVAAESEYSESSQHLHICFIGHSIKLQVEVIADVREEVGRKHETHY